MTRKQNKDISIRLKGGWLFVGLLLAILVFGALSSYYTVSDKETAVVTTFGKVTDTKSAGVHFKLPFGIQKAYKVPIHQIFKIELGYSSQKDDESVETESKMISGDFNIVNVDFFIEYKIVDPQKYLFSSQDPERILKSLAQSQIRNVVGSSTVDAVLTEGRTMIESQAKQMILDELVKYDIGVDIWSLKIQDSEGPTQEVRNAFKAVENAGQNSKTVINEAEAYRSQKEPMAKAEADKLLSNATYQKQNRINTANQEVARFEAIYNEYILNAGVTRQRMYYEALEAVLPGVKLYIDTGDGVNKILPLESFITNN